jgi:hypothetical protein
LAAKSSFVEKHSFFGQFRILELRNSARIVQTGRFAFWLLTRSLAQIYGGIAQQREILKVGSNPVRVDSLLKWFSCRSHLRKRFLDPGDAPRLSARR